MGHQPLTGKLPDLEQSKSAVLNSLTSPSSQRTYDHAIREFIEWYSPRIPTVCDANFGNLLGKQKLLVLWSTGAAGALRDGALRQSRDSLNSRPKRCDRLLDHESLVRQVRHNPLDDHECGEAKDRKPPGMGHHDVIPTGQSFSLGNIEKELHETFEQRRANVVDVLSSADAVAVLSPKMGKPWGARCRLRRLTILRTLTRNGSQCNWGPNLRVALERSKSGRHSGPSENKVWSTSSTVAVNTLQHSLSPFAPEGVRFLTTLC
jgi:hypothetical protein